MRIAYAGAEGAFAHEACLAFAADMHAVPVPDFAAVVAAVEAGEAEAGMLPVRNSRAGDVDDVRALLAQGRVDVAGEHDLPIRLHLLGLPGARIEGIRTVTSHPMALRQCAVSIARLGMEARPAANTALAARELTDSGTGVLASSAAARLYGLETLRRDMQDDPDNVTVFALVRRRG